MQDVSTDIPSIMGKNFQLKMDELKNKWMSLKKNTRALKIYWMQQQTFDILQLSLSKQLHEDGPLGP